MDEFKDRVLSPEYACALELASAAMEELELKIVARIRLSPEEGERLLNLWWAVQLCAVRDGDIENAKGTDEDLIEPMSRLLRRCYGYTVEFTDRYTVKEK